MLTVANGQQDTLVGSSPVVVKDYTYPITPAQLSDWLVIGPIRLADLSINGVTSGVNTALTLASRPHTIISTARGKGHRRRWARCPAATWATN